MERNADPIGIDARVGRRKSKTVREATIPLWPKPSRNVFSRIPRVSWIVRTDEFNIGTREYARPAAKNIPGHGMLFPAWNRNQGNLLRFILLCLLLSLFIILKRVWFLYLLFSYNLSFFFDRVSLDFLSPFEPRGLFSLGVSFRVIHLPSSASLLFSLRFAVSYSSPIPFSTFPFTPLYTLPLFSSLRTLSLRTFRSSLRLLFSNFHFPETLHAS